MAKKDLTRNDGKPFNVRKVNGRWMFIPEVFGASSTSVPRELLLVPVDLIPASAYSDGNTAYVPEDRIRAYISGPQFARTAEQYKTVSTPGAVGVRGGDTRATGFDPRTVVDNASKFLKTFDSSTRSQVYQNVKNKSGTGVAQVDSTTTFNNLTSRGIYGSPMAKNNPWEYVSSMVTAAANNQSVRKFASTGDGRVTSLDGKVEYLILPGDDGKISADKITTIDDYSRKLGGATEERAAAIRKEYGLKGSGRLTLQEINDLVGYARAASWRNMTMAETNQISGRLPLKPTDVMGELKRKGTGGPRTTITESVSTFSPEQASLLLDQFYKENIGRAPTAKEVSSFSKLLKTQAEKRPNVSKTTSTTSGGVTRVKATQTAGFGSDEARVLAEKEAAKVTGRTGYVSATKYMDVIMSMIRNPVG